MDETRPVVASDSSAPHQQEPLPTPTEEQTPDWKAQARKWERRAKANSDAAEKLADASRRVTELEAALSEANANADAITQALDAASGDPALAKLLLARKNVPAKEFAQMLRDFAATPPRPVVTAIGHRGTPATQDSTAAFVRRLFS